IKLTDLGKNIADALRGLIGTFEGVEVIPQEITELQEKITFLCSRVERIYKEEFANKRSLSVKESTRVSRRLGPYRREVRKMDRTSIQDKAIKKEFDELKERIEELMLLKEKLKS
ncbi:MAG: hypothetical protein QMD78_07230, partial [Methanocellales archaeon]|nr:hypothetical protein [Methanocellales archaeon]